MQYCPNCQVQIRGIKARCPLCQRELLTAVHEWPVWKDGEKILPGESEPAISDAGGAADGTGMPAAPEAAVAGGILDTGAAAGGGTGWPAAAETAVADGNSAAGGVPAAAETAAAKSVQILDDDPFVQLPETKVSFMLMVRLVTFLCVSFEIMVIAAHIITGFQHRWLYAAMLAAPLAWVDFQIAVYYRSNMIRMLTIQAYLIMAVCLFIQNLTRSGTWAVTWVIPAMFCLLVAVTFAAAKAQGMQLHEFILYPAFDVLMSLLQIIPIVMGKNSLIAPAVICIAGMLILVSSLVIFQGRMLRGAAYKYLHM